MKKWAICDCNTMEIASVYEAEENSQHLYGGPYGWPDHCMHIEVVEDAEDAMLSELEIKEIEVQVGTQRVPDGEPQLALDAEGNTLQDANGDDIMIQDYKDEPVMEMQKRAVRKD